MCRTKCTCAMRFHNLKRLVCCFTFYYIAFANTNHVTDSQRHKSSHISKTRRATSFRVVRDSAKLVVATMVTKMKSIRTNMALLQVESMEYKKQYNINEEFIFIDNLPDSKLKSLLSQHSMDAIQYHEMRRVLPKLRNYLKVIEAMVRLFSSEEGTVCSLFRAACYGPFRDKTPILAFYGGNCHIRQARNKHATNTQQSRQTRNKDATHTQQTLSKHATNT